MKKFVLMALAAIAIVSCSEDDNAVTTNSNNNNGNNNQPTAVEGTWKLTSVTSANAYDGNDDGTATTDIMAETGCFNNSNIVFGTANTAVFNLEVPVMGTCFMSSMLTTYEHTGNTYLFTATDDEGETSIEELTLNGNTLILATEYEVEIQIGSTIQTVALPMTLIYTKQ